MVMEKVFGSYNRDILLSWLVLAFSVTELLVMLKSRQSGSAVMLSLVCLHCLLVFYQESRYARHRHPHSVVLYVKNLFDRRRTRSRVFDLEAKQSSNSP
ncbi:hypothetical protein TIFTF001_026844, partial [Ficus carica]